MIKAALQREKKLILITSICYLSSSPDAKALLRFNDSKDQVFVTFTAGATYDSNIYAIDPANLTNQSAGDYNFSYGLAVDYSRRAGYIGVDAHLSWDISQFLENSGESTAYPSASVEFTKSVGRTTGSLLINARQSSRPDPNANLRTESLNYGATLNFRYPVIERYSFSGSLGYSTVNYAGNNSTLVDLSTYTASLDLFYVLSDERDLFFGYRYRNSDTGVKTKTTDNAFSVGVSGRIIPKLNGSARVGIQSRNSQRVAPTPDETFDSTFAAISASWGISKRATVTGTVAQDFSTTSTNFDTKTTSLNLGAQYALNSKITLDSNIGYGWIDYLGQGINRADHYFSWGAGFQWNVWEHLQIQGGYNYMRNWSTLSQANYSKSGVNIGLTSRW